MLTHHQYTYIQKEQNIAVSSTFDHAVYKNLAPKSKNCASTGVDYCGVKMQYLYTTKRAILLSSKQVESQHFPSNLVFRINVTPITPPGSSAYRSEVPPLADVQKPTLQLNAEKYPPSTNTQNNIEYSEKARPLKEKAEGSHNPLKCRQRAKYNLQKVIKDIESSPAIESLVMKLENTAWSSVSAKQFLSYVDADIYTITAFQRYLTTTGEICPALELLADSSKENLIRHKYGCHVLRILVKRLPALSQTVSKLTLHSFADMCCNEFSNKVMQVIAAQDDLFRKSCFEKFCVNWNTIKKNVSSIYLLTVCLRYTPNDTAYFGLVGEYLVDQRGYGIIKDKHDKRILARYIEYCTEQELDIFYRLLRFESEFIERCSDKYMVYIFRLLLRRGHKQSEYQFAQGLRTEAHQVLGFKVVRLLLDEIFSDESYPDELRDGILAALSQEKKLQDHLLEINANRKRQSATGSSLSNMSNNAIDNDRPNDFN
jgi:hypothetical protein